MAVPLQNSETKLSFHVFLSFGFVYLLFFLIQFEMVVA